MIADHLERAAAELRDVPTLDELTLAAGGALPCSALCVESVSSSACHHPIRSSRVCKGYASGCSLSRKPAAQRRAGVDQTGLGGAHHAE